MRRCDKLHFSQDLPFDRRVQLLVLTTVRIISDKKKKKREGKKIGIPNHDMRIGKQNEKWSN